MDTVHTPELTQAPGTQPSVEDLPPPVALTAKAAAMVRETIERENMQGSGLRIMVVGGGCSGFQYGLDLEKEEKLGDTVYEQEGLKIYVDPMSLQYLEGTMIDYVEGIYGSGFSFKNPNVKSTCGCGSSFSV